MILRWFSLGLPLILAVLQACGTPEPPSDEPTPSPTPTVSAVVVEGEVSVPESFLLVTLDTTRPDHLEPYGAEGVETPHLLALAQRGGLFERAWAVSPVTLPSHASLFTGLYPFETGVRNNGIHYLEPSVPTLAEVLQGAGFRTAAFVSAAVLDRRYGLDRGFELYDDDLSGGGPRSLRLNPERSAGATVDAAREWLDEVKSGERFFLWVHLFDPHAAYEPPEPWASRYRNAPYDGEIAYTDAELGRLFSHEALSHSLTMVIADHGEGLGQHGESTHAMLAYESTLHIPWLVHLPGMVAGGRFSEPVSQVDLLPTVLDLLEIEGGPAEISGRSLAPSLRGEEVEETLERTLYAETLVPFYTYGWFPLMALRQGDWKLLDGVNQELFDLTQDPGEERDLSAVSADRTAEMRDELHRMAEFEEATAGPSSTLDPEALARLRSLGYVVSSGSVPERQERPDPRRMIAVHEALEKAQNLFFRGQMKPAEDELRLALREDPENPVGLSTLARLRAAQGRLDAAIRLVDRALEVDPKNLELWVTRGLVELSGGRPQEALEAFETALTIDPRWLDARLQAAQVLARLGQEESAQQRILDLVEDEPSNVRVMIAAVEIVDLPQRNLEKAEKELRSAVEREPFFADGWRVLGRVLESQERWDEAFEAYSEGLRHQPEEGLLHAHLGSLLARMGRPEAENHLQAALRFLPSPPATLHQSLARIAIQRQDWSKVEIHARQALELDPELSIAWNLLAAALEETERREEALEAYGQSLDQDPGNWQARFNRGLLLRRLERFEAAAEDFKGVLEAQPKHEKSHFEMGILYAGPLDNLPRARYHLEQVATGGGPLASQAQNLLRRF